jgi:hypothetical protein
VPVNVMVAAEELPPTLLVGRPRKEGFASPLYKSPALWELHCIMQLSICAAAASCSSCFITTSPGQRQPGLRRAGHGGRRRGAVVCAAPQSQLPNAGFGVSQLRPRGTPARPTHADRAYQTASVCAALPAQHIS